jgi:uncharacterized membrane-anchored protein
MTRSFRLMLTAAAMTAFLVGLIADHHVRRANGAEILLDLEPVDPRDLLAGYYIVISTPLHSIDPEQLDGDNVFDAGGDIYVVVEAEADGSWQPVSIHSEQPVDGVFLLGKVQWASRNAIRVRYNIERFYADADTAQALEDIRRLNRASLRLIVSVGADGRAIIRGLEINGERQIDPFL